MLEMVEEAALKLYGDAGSPSNSACNYDRPKPSHSYSSPQPILSFLSLGLPFFLSERCLENNGPPSFFVFDPAIAGW